MPTLATFEVWLLRALLWIVIVLGLCAGAIALWVHFTRPTVAPVLETAAPAVIQKDGSTELQRQATDPTAKPLNELPAGATLQRSVKAIVHPKAQTLTGKTAAGMTQTISATPNDVAINFDLDKLKDGTERVVASSPDGSVTGSLDIPVAPLPPPPPASAVGASYGLPVAGVKAYGLWAEHDFWRIRTGIEVDHIGAPRESTNLVMVRAGVTF